MLIKPTKALTVYQPWASLIAQKLKKNETRSWRTKYRGPLAIHAAIGMPKEAKAFCPEVARIIGVNPYSGSHWYYLEQHSDVMGGFGQILATCNLVDCVQVIDEEPGIFALLENGKYIDGPELLFGDYRPGRYVWILDNIKKLPKPVAVKGKQGLWNWYMDSV